MRYVQKAGASVQLRQDYVDEWVIAEKTSVRSIVFN